MKKILFAVILICLISSLFGSDVFGKDKVMHFSSSAFITCWNYGFSNDIMHLSHQKSITFGVSITGILGISKEFSDKYFKKSKFSWKDILFDAGGIALGCVIINNSRLKSP